MNADPDNDEFECDDCGHVSDIENSRRVGELLCCDSCATKRYTPTTPWKPESHWDDHPDHSVEDWKYEIANGDTRQGYVDWVNSRLEAA